MTITIELNGVKVKRDIPTSWPQVTFAKFLKLESCKDEVEIIAMFTGVEPETMRKSKIINLEVVLKALHFLRTPDYLPPTVPTEILGYKIPKNLEFQSMAQYADMKAELDKPMEPRDRLRQYPLFCAIYALGDYQTAGEERVKAVTEEFMKAPCGEVLAVGNFTLLNLAGLREPTATVFHRLGILMRKGRLVLSGLYHRLAFTVRFYFWKRRRATSERKS